MARYAIPGVALGVLYRGREYVRGYGVTNVDYPVPVDGDTVFRIASNTKTFTGTTVMQLVEQGRLDLDATVRSYLPDFHTADPAASARVTVRQLLNHSAGWLGDFIIDTGPGDDALARYVAAMAVLPQLTAPGEMFSYNNAALALAGRLIEVAAGRPYETTVRQLLVDPLRLAHIRFFTDEIVGFNIAASHNVVDGRPVVDPSLWALPRAINATGGLISSARDMLRYARFHLGDGTVPDGDTRLLSRQSLLAMRTNPGPGGTFIVELDGVGITWMLRPTAEGVHIVQHGGDWTGQHSGFLTVPDSEFALVMLTNSTGGQLLLAELFADDWALARYAGVHNLPAVPRLLSPAELAAYEGRYLFALINPDGTVGGLEFEMVGEAGQLSVRLGGVVVWRLVFYRPDYVLVLNLDGTPSYFRSNFERGADGTVAWFRVSGRLVQHLLAQAGVRELADQPGAVTLGELALLRKL
jgi:CubicO group peptidase (beta-lactamase class C family)